MRDTHSTLENLHHQMIRGDTWMVRALCLARILQANGLDYDHVLKIDLDQAETMFLASLDSQRLPSGTGKSV